MTETLSAYLLALALAFAPPAKSKRLPGWDETDQQRSDRYASIANDIATVVSEPGQTMPGNMSTKAGATLLLALAIGESGLDPDVDLGPCYRGGRYRSRCDAGDSASIWQLRVGAGTTPQGWGRAELFADRKKAARAALALARGSWWSCRSNRVEHRLAAYGSGNCQGALDGSAKRIGLWQRMMAWRPKR